MSITTSLMRHSKFGVCSPAGHNTIDGADFLSFRFANGFIHFPICSETLADLSEAMPLIDEDGKLYDPPLSRLGLDVEIGDTDITLAPRRDPHAAADDVVDAKAEVAL